MANKKAKGRRAKTRNLFKGTKLTIERLLKKYNVGDKVVIKPNGSYHSGLPFRRFAGLVGVIEEKVGRTTYMVKLLNNNKRIKVGNAHLKIIE